MSRKTALVAGALSAIVLCLAQSGTATGATDAAPSGVPAPAAIGSDAAPTVAPVAAPAETSAGEVLGPPALVPRPVHRSQRFTVDEKMAAVAARKRAMAEIEARRAASPALAVPGADGVSASTPPAAPTGK